MRNIKLALEYDGTNYAGWQRQKNAVTIQDTLEKAIKQITSENVEVTGSSRTDAGVHAKGYVCNFYTESSVKDTKFKDAINSKLPKDIVVLDSSEVEETFHARYSSIGKKYSYSILNRNQPPAIGRDYIYHYKGSLNYEAMKEAAAYFIGTHDFAAFKNTGSSVKSSVRTITVSEIDIIDETIKYCVAGNGFLYNMVRIMAGTLIDVGAGKIEPKNIMEIINSKDRKKAGKSAPANGLCLEEVYY